MKRLITCLFICAVLAVPAVCAEYEYAYGDEVELYPEAEMDSLFDSLPDEVKSEIADFIAAENDAERSKALKDKLDISYWLGYIWEVLSELIVPCASGCTSILSVILLSKILTSAASISGEGEFCNIYGLCVSLVCAVSVAQVTVSAISSAVAYVERICAMMSAMLPVMEAVMLSSGSVTQAALNGTSLMIYITLTENLTLLVLVPLAGALFALSCASGVFNGVNISSLVSGVKRVLMTLLGFFLMIFSFVLGVQNSLAKGADSLSVKTVRFALGSYIPIVGGAVSEALTTVSAGFDLIRRSAGGIAVVLILFITLPPLITLFLTRAVLLICKSISETLECNEASKIMGDADSVLSVFCALAVMSALFFIFAVILFMNSGLN